MTRFTIELSFDVDHACVMGSAEVDSGSGAGLKEGRGARTSTLPDLIVLRQKGLCEPTRDKLVSTREIGIQADCAFV
ncbi:hypothetical protein WG66_008742 [Moniliophthora roreri]|nr:hypothetical protein WG66_008742 [Moniliophthora roreri]